MIKQGENLLQKENKRKINYTKWAFVLGTPIALAGAIAALGVVPEIRCGIGLKSEGCAIRNQPVEITVYDYETGTELSGVKVQVSSQGTPEVQMTDDNGFVHVQIPSKGKAFVSFSKKDYQTRSLNIDLENEQNTTRRFALSRLANTQGQKTSDPNIPSQRSADMPQASSSGGILSDTSSDPSSSTQLNTNVFTSNSGVFPSKYIARWEGTVIFNNLETKSTAAQSGVSVSFNDGKTGSKVGDIFYNNGYCQGSLILKNVKSNSLELFENIPSGINCTKNSTVIVTFIGDDIIEFKRTATGDHKIGKGLLTRRK
jgi:hypothetical protein